MQAHTEDVIRPLSRLLTLAGVAFTCPMTTTTKTETWRFCPGCGKERRAPNGIMVPHNMYFPRNNDGGDMGPCPGSDQLV